MMISFHTITFVSYDYRSIDHIHITVEDLSTALLDHRKTNVYMYMWGIADVIHLVLQRYLVGTRINGSYSGSGWSFADVGKVMAKEFPKFAKSHNIAGANAIYEAMRDDEYCKKLAEVLQKYPLPPGHDFEWGK